MSKSLKFLRQVVGASGYQVLSKALENNPQFSGSLLPRVIYSWVNLGDFKGNIPGTKDQIEFHKTESGYEGSLEFDGPLLTFDRSSVFDVVGAIAIALNIETNLQKSVKDTNLVNLGKNIDILVGSTKKRSSLKDIRSRAQAKLNKVENTGQGHAPYGKLAEHKGATPPTPPTATQTQKQFASAYNKGPKLASSEDAKFSKSEMETRCGTCSMRLFKNEVFVGCYCTRELAKDTVLLAKSDIYELKFGDSWDAESVQIVLDSLKRKS